MKQVRPMSMDAVIEYGATIGMSRREAEDFFDYYESNGWKVGGRAPMKSWHAAARRWHRNAPQFQRTNRGERPAAPRMPLAEELQRLVRDQRRGDPFATVSQYRPELTRAEFDKAVIEAGVEVQRYVGIYYVGIRELARRAEERCRRNGVQR